MATVTYRDVLAQKYQAFFAETQPIVGDALEKHMSGVPNKDYYDMMQLALYLFPTDDIGTHLDDMLVMGGATLEQSQKDQLVPIIRPYIATLRRMQAKMNA
jgi:hypothetical protein